MQSAARTPHFVSGLVDFAFVGGASLLIFVLYRWFPIGSQTHLLIAAGAVTFALNWPHFAATSQRLYGTHSSVRQYPATAVLAPLISVGAVAASLASPLLVAPLFLKVFLLWSPFHYSGQTVGVTLLYARRHGFALSKPARVLLVAFVYLTFMSQSATSETVPTGILYAGVRIPSFGAPTWLPTVLRSGMWGAGALVAILLAVDAWRAHRLPPVLLLLPAIAQYVWFVPGSNVANFRELVPAFHALQYLLIAWSMHLSERLVEGRSEPGATFVVSRSASWMAVNLIGGIALFGLLPKLVGPASLDPGVAAGIVAAGVQVHHFFVDGVIWKLKSRAVSSALMMSVSDALELRPGKRLHAMKGHST